MGDLVSAYGRNVSCCYTVERSPAKNIGWCSLSYSSVIKVSYICGGVGFLFSSKKLQSLPEVSYSDLNRQSIDQSINQPLFTFVRLGLNSNHFPMLRDSQCSHNKGIYWFFVIPHYEDSWIPICWMTIPLRAHIKILGVVQAKFNPFKPAPWMPFDSFSWAKGLEVWGWGKTPGGSPSEEVPFWTGHLFKTIQAFHLPPKKKLLVGRSPFFGGGSPFCT